MSIILKYFKRESTLPSSSRSLSKVVPCEGITTANKEVNKVVESMKSAMEYNHGSNGSANTVQAEATQVSRRPYERYIV